MELASPAAVMHRFIDLHWFEWGLLQGEAGIVLELSDKKARGFMVQIALPR
jgi:hypothetical protein